MPLDRDQLRAKLDQLHQELASLQNVDPQAREHLEQTLAEIETGWDAMTARQEAQSAEQPASEQPGAIQRLTEGARHFEDDHPEFAALVGSFIHALGRMGI
jgi:hypothetical protein